MESLKSHIPVWAAVLNMSEASLYERQKALIREGLFTVSGGGHGGGVQADSNSFSLLFMAALGSDSLVHCVEQVRELLELPISNATRCSLTGKRTLLEALAALFSDTATAKPRQINGITISRTAPFAQIRGEVAGRLEMSTFKTGERLEQGDVRVLAIVGRRALRKLIDDAQSVDRRNRRLARERRD